MEKPSNQSVAPTGAADPKSCFKCTQLKPLSEYYKHKEMADGHLGKCKSCTKTDTLERITQKAKLPEWLENERLRQLEKYHRLGHGWKKPNAEKRAENSRRNYAKNPEKMAANRKLYAANNSERLASYRKRYINKYPEKEAARRASNHLHPNVPTNHLHHWSYRPEYATDLIELTKPQHYTLHRFIKYDATVMLYRRTSDKELIDNKEAHLAWAQKVFEIHGQGPIS